jgi:hypothetical protein
MEDQSSTSEVGPDVVYVAIVNKDTLEDKLKEHALITLVGALCGALVTQGVPLLTKQITKFRTNRALAKKTKEITEEKD